MVRTVGWRKSCATRRTRIHESPARSSVAQSRRADGVGLDGAKTLVLLSHHPLTVGKVLVDFDCALLVLLPKVEENHVEMVA